MTTTSVVTVIETGTETAVSLQDRTEPNQNRGFMPLYTVRF